MFARSRPTPEFPLERSLFESNPPICTGLTTALGEPPPSMALQSIYGAHQVYASLWKPCCPISSEEIVPLSVRIYGLLSNKLRSRPLRWELSRSPLSLSILCKDLKKFLSVSSSFPLHSH